ncbi:MAG: SpaA isopeptide-forming pilin-related protein [Eubacteriales bacterium]
MKTALFNLIKQFPAKKKILSLVLTLSLLISLFPMSDLAAWSAPANVTINKSVNASYFTNQWGTPLTTGFYYVASSGELAYCADQEATGPGRTGYSLNDDGLGNASYLSGIQSIIQNGYPKYTNGLSADDARYATQIAIHWIENYYLGAGQGYDASIRNTTNANGHDGALAFALVLYDVGVSLAPVDPTLFLYPPSAWTDIGGGVLQCNMYVDEDSTDYWQVLSLPAGVTTVGETTFTGDVNLTLQLMDAAAYAASPKTITLEGYSNRDTSNIHVFTTSGGYQSMVAVSTQTNGLDPVYKELGDATGDLSIHKVTSLQSSGAQVPESGAIFQVYSVSTGMLVTVLTTDAAGNAEALNLPAGSYNVHQSYAPPGTILAPDQLVPVTGGVVSYGAFVNNSTYFPITKRDTSSGALVAGATITISQSDVPIASAVTGTDGNAWFESLPAGQYSWNESAAPAGYLLDTNTYIITLNADGSVSGTTAFTDVKSNGYVDVYKTTDRLGVPAWEPGAVFQIYLTSSGSYAAAPVAVRDQITTDANGHAISKLLPYGNYTMRQTVAPVGTVMNPTVWTFDVGTNGAGTMVATDTDTVNVSNTATVGRLEIAKTTNRGYSAPEAGAIFQIYNAVYASYAAAPTTERDILTTDAAGYDISNWLPYGIYTVHQTFAPDGTKAMADFNVTLGSTNNETIHRDLVNQTFWGDIKILKNKSAPSDTSGILTPEPGATFRIYPSEYVSYAAAIAALNPAQEQALTDEITSGIAGAAMTSHQLPFGSYTVEQIDTAANLLTFKVDAWTVTIGSVDNQTYTYVRNNEIYEQYLSVVKRDAETGQVIKMAGVTFEIFAADQTTVLSDSNGVSSFVTDANGRIDIKDLALQVGDYYIRETKAPMGYTLNTDLKAFSVSITDHGSSIVTIDYGVDVREVPFVDTAQTCRLTVEKQGDVLTSATLIDAINPDTGARYSDEDGTVLSIYDFGYSLTGKAGAVFEVFVGAVDIGDQDGIVKMFDKNGDGVKDTSLTAGTSLGTITTAAVLQKDGTTKYIASLDGLPLDAVTGTAQYVVKEVTAPTGDLINQAPIFFEFRYADQTIKQISQEQTMADTRQKVQITVDKQKEAGVWNVTKQAFDWPMVQAEGILFGLYTTTDITAPDDSILIPADTLVDVLLTNANGIGKSTQDLPFGDNYVKELNVTADVVMDATTTYDITTAPLADQTVPIASFAINKGTAIINRQIAGTMEIYKIAADTQLPMMGVVFEVYDAAANLVDTVTTGIDGHTQTKVLPFGAYTLIETKTVTGYALADKQSFSIYLTPHDGEIFSEAQMTVVDQKMAQVEVFKVTADGTQTPMNGVVFGVFDAKTNLQIASTTTDKDGHGVLYVLAGNYYLQELKTWDGYSLSSERIPITAEFAHLYTFRQTNTLTELRVTKISTSGTPLAGMQFTVTNKETGQLISFVYDAIRKGYVATSVFRETPDPAVVATTLITGTEGTALILGLVKGEYIVTEIVAPAGYNLDSKPTDTTIGTRTSGVLGASVTIKNSPVTAKTGEIGNNCNLISAALCFLGLATAVLIILRDRKGKLEKEKDQK